MKLKNKFLFSFLVSSAVVVSSTFLKIIPCRIAPNVPSPIYKWTACRLTNNTPDLVFAKEFLGITTSILSAYIIVFLTTFVLTMLIFSRLTKKKK